MHDDTPTANPISATSSPILLDEDDDAIALQDESLLDNAAPIQHGFDQPVDLISTDASTTQAPADNAPSPDQFHSAGSSDPSDMEMTVHGASAARSQSRSRSKSASQSQSAQPSGAGSTEPPQLNDASPRASATPQSDSSRELAQEISARLRKEIQRVYNEYEDVGLACISADLAVEVNSQVYKMPVCTVEDSDGVGLHVDYGLISSEDAPAPFSVRTVFKQGHMQMLRSGTVRRRELAGEKDNNEGEVANGASNGAEPSRKRKRTEADAGADEDVLSGASDSDEGTVTSSKKRPRSITSELRTLSQQIRWVEECRRLADTAHDKKEDTWRTTSASFHDTNRLNRERHEGWLVNKMSEHDRLLHQIVNELKGLYPLAGALKWENKWETPATAVVPSQATPVGIGTGYAQVGAPNVRPIPRSVGVRRS